MIDHLCYRLGLRLASSGVENCECSIATFDPDLHIWPPAD